MVKIDFFFYLITKNILILEWKNIFMEIIICLYMTF